jgi:hypothetical protein
LRRPQWRSARHPHGHMVPAGHAARRSVARTERICGGGQRQPLRLPHRLRHNANGTPPEIRAA